MRRTIDDESFDLQRLNSELSELAGIKHLNRLASLGLRGEVIFPAPYLLQRNPYLLGYYRLLYGFSAKAFYDQGPFGRFRSLEDRGQINDEASAVLLAFCRSLTRTGEMLIEPIAQLSPAIVNDLQLLTLGAQFRGSGNVKVGQDAIDSFFDYVKLLLAAYNPNVKGRTLKFQNDSDRTVIVRFASDPDVSITVQLGAEERKLVAIELKGGTDVSNIWNRLGEAEKSHAKAKAAGFNERWTITKVDLHSDREIRQKAKRQSQTSTEFFCLDHILDATSEESMRFRQLLGSTMGVKLAP